MTKSTFGDLSTAAASNTVIDGQNVDENCQMNTLNNAIRALGAAGKGALSYVSTSGTDTYTATLAPVPDGYATGFQYLVNFLSPNTLVAPTINLNGLGAQTITLGNGSTSLVAGSLNGCHILEYDGSVMRVLNPAIVPAANSANNIGSVPAASVWTTGDVKVTIKTTADSGWVMMDDGTIGDASSGATTRANADTSALFVLLWNNTANADCAVSSGRGASAAADFSAHKTIALPKVLGRAIAVSGAGSGLTSRALAHVLGEETHQLTIAEMPSHTHGVVSDGTTTNAGTHNRAGQNADQTNSTNSAGSDGAHNNMQPSSFLNVMIKL